MFELTSPHSPRFVVQLLPRDEGITVRAAGPNGPLEAHTHLQRIDDVLRMASQPSFHEDIGRGLFRALFSGAIESAYRAAYTQATLDGVPLVLELHLAHDVLRLGRYPWELMHDGTRFLVQSGSVNLVRTLDFPEAIPPYEPRGPLDVLVAAAQPDDRPALTSVYDALDETLTGYMRMDALDLAALFPPTWDSLMDWLLAGAPDVLHFEGYGDFTRTGRLSFEGGRGGDPVDAAALGAAFYSTRLRLIALSASTAITHGEESLLSSIAPTLVEAGIPAVIAAQRILPDDLAAKFWSTFYRALLDGDDVEHAVLIARQQLRRTTHWHALTLYHRAPTFAADTAPVPVRLDTAAPDHATVGWTVRAALWIQATDAPPPAPHVVYRLIGVDPPPDMRDDHESTLETHPGGTGTATLHAGPITVRLTAPGCVVHNHAQHTRLFSPHAETPPLWFALTARRPGDVQLTFELSQDEHILATVEHPLNVITETAASSGTHENSAGEGMAVVHTHCADLPVPRAAHTVTHALADDQRESHEDGREGNYEQSYRHSQGRELSGDAAGRELRRAPLPDIPEYTETLAETLVDEAAVIEALDGVSDLLQTGAPPDDEHDPLMRIPGVSVRRSARTSAAIPSAPPSIHDEQTQIDFLSPLHNPAAARELAGLPPRSATARPRTVSTGVTGVTGTVATVATNTVAPTTVPASVAPFEPLPEGLEDIAAPAPRSATPREQLMMLIMIALLVIVGLTVLVMFVL